MSSDRPWQHCYVVSLPDDAERRLHVGDELARAGVAYSFADGIPGASLDRDSLVAAGVATRRFLDAPMTPLWAKLNQIGCSLSHLAVLEAVAAVSGTTPTLICEDDVHLAADFVERATGLIDRLPAECELIYFGHGFAGASETPPPSGVEPARVPRGMYAYLVWPSAAATIVDRVLPLDLPLDECVSHLIAAGHLSAYIANPAIAEPHVALTSRIHRAPEEVS